MVNRGICTIKQGFEEDDSYNRLIPRAYPTIFQWGYAPHENRTREPGEVIPTSLQVLPTRLCPWGSLLFLSRESSLLTVFSSFIP
ncbi:hypothetical protein F511_35880 [Dorcoceras hygrometricum]|uniref:Uncharacterized protein n=1 Tax=Dorcoceras hygrometricum TaxID=472368 RepID=A0A2Z7AYW4_9LAMI|nr:hypothetical protein F511_35880 [Dorcoceras hygrometricum]